MRHGLRVIAVLAPLLLASPAPAADPIVPGTISVEPSAVEPEARASMPAFVEAVGHALTAREFTLLDAGHGRFVAHVTISRVAVGTTTAKVPVAGREMQTGGPSSSVGVGLNVSLPTAKTKTVPLQQIRLDISIRKRGEQAVLWQGAAMTVRAPATAEGKDAAVATDLSEAIFRVYPAQAEGLISVP